jgi:hypothetical protein
VSGTPSSQAITWHLNGEHGISSEAIYDRLTYGVTTARWFSNHPHDPSDFRRCELLLRAVPEFRARFSEMADESPVWRALVERWSEIAAVFEEECPGVFTYEDHGNRWAYRTYALMNSIISTAKGEPVSVSGV